MKRKKTIRKMLPLTRAYHHKITPLEGLLRSLENFGNDLHEAEKRWDAEQSMLQSSQRRCGELEDMNALLKVELEKAIRGGYVMEGEDAGLIELEAPELFPRGDFPLSEQEKINRRVDANRDFVNNLEATQ